MGCIAFVNDIHQWLVIKRCLIVFYLNSFIHIMYTCTLNGLCIRLEDIIMRPQLHWVVASFSLDQYLYDFSDHGISDCTPWYIDIFKLVLILVLLGLVRDYDSYWHVTAFVFDYFMGTDTCLVYFHMDMQYNFWQPWAIDFIRWFLTTPLLGYL